jgi:hypothetical protein
MARNSLDSQCSSQHKTGGLPVFVVPSSMHAVQITTSLRRQMCGMGYRLIQIRYPWDDFFLGKRPEHNNDSCQLSRLENQVVVNRLEKGEVGQVKSRGPYM